MSNIQKEYKYIDLNALSGSGENFRTINGGHWSIVSSSLTGETIEFTNFDFEPSGHPAAIYQIAANLGKDREQVTSISSDKILFNYRFPVRIIGFEDNIDSAAHWKALVLGGSYAGNSYPSLYQTDTFDDHTFFYNMPYSTTEARNLSSSPKEVEISYAYNYYAKEYEEYIAGFNENTLPDYYVFQSYKGNRYDGNSELDYSVDADIEDWVTLGNPLVPGKESTGYRSVNWFEEVWDSALPPYQVTNADEYIMDSGDDYGKYLHKTLHMQNYLISSFRNYTPNAALAATVQSKLSNIFFDEHAVAELLVPTATNHKTFPYYIKIDFTQGDSISVDTSFTSFNEAGATGIFLDALAAYDYSPKFLNTLKEVFTEQTSLAPKSIDFVKVSDYYSGSSKIIEADGASLRSVDAFEMLSYNYNDYSANTTDGYFVGDSSDSARVFNRAMPFDTDGTYRFQNSINTLGMISNLRYFVGGESQSGMSSPNNVYDLFNVGEYRSIYENRTVGLGAGTVSSPSIKEFYGGAAIDKIYNLSGDSKYHETVAYRIEKKDAEGITIQNNWILAAYNDESGLQNLTEFEFYDTQVKYDEEYTYNIYAYILAITAKYNFSDLTLTRVLANTAEGLVGTVSAYQEGRVTRDSETVECIEWYDPSTDEPTPPLAFKMTAFDYGESAATNTLATSAQDVSSNSYQADFYVNYENTAKIIEIPLTTRTLKVVDNPPTALDIMPYQVVDDSQQIGFHLKDDTFVPATYPTNINADNLVLRDDYLNANNLAISDKLEIDSVSRSRYIQIFRMNEKPERFSDFSGHEIALIDLAIPGSNEVSSTYRFLEKRAANKKYYYLFRALNEHKQPGYVFEIYEAEIVNDGGYKHARFNSLYEEDLAVDVYKEPSRTAKNLLQLKPTYGQLALNYNNADFDETAHSQLTNISVGVEDNVLWGKTFKVRLTSRKTGKKIDLNITYDYEDAT